MAYVNGSAATMADLKSAIETAAVAAGWTLTSGILSKNGCYFMLTAAAGANPQLLLQGGTGQSGSTLTGQPQSPYANAGTKIASCSGQLITFPVTYEIHTFTGPDEIYCVINYNSDFYQQLSFGQSDVPGLGGTGAWFTGSYVGNYVMTDDTYGPRVFTAISWPETYGVSTYAGMSCGLFLESGAELGGSVGSYVHGGLDSVAWRNTGNGSALTGMRGAGMGVASLLMQLPNISNQATILLPIKPQFKRSSGGITTAVNLKNARYMRIDNVVPGEIVTFGADQWKCYPHYRKDATARNGFGWASGAQHSGTMGFAIRYTGT